MHQIEIFQGFCRGPG